jgi:hypothetical protein
MAVGCPAAFLLATLLEFFQSKMEIIVLRKALFFERMIENGEI